ncbi:MAG: 5-formyltetrahydrofolate cyclo-ligase, partial [candidate division Zixibacteria bacterium]|nr:5-formyltetrahydrofolate cyclo-ligase [candidate division Zixibacteria bacterium]
PTPRLRAGFKKFDPVNIPEDKLSEAATLSRSDRWAEAVPLEELPALDAIVTGSVAVTTEGRRCGKGEGYGDLEYAILRELGFPPLPVVTTVHPLQIVEEFPRDPIDLPLSWIVTSSETIEVKNPLPPPKGIDWNRLSDEDLQKMPVLKQLKEMGK